MGPASEQSFFLVHLHQPTALGIGEETARLLELMNQNNEQTEVTKELLERIEALTKELHSRLIDRAK